MKKSKLETPTSPFVLFFIVFLIRLEICFGFNSNNFGPKKAFQTFFVELENFPIEFFGPKLFKKQLTQNNFEVETQNENFSEFIRLTPLFKPISY